MASYLQRVILIALILSIAIRISIVHGENSEDDSDWGDDYEIKSDGGDDSEIEIDGEDDSEIEHYLRNLCSDTKKPKLCWKIIKPEINRFTDTDSRNVAGVIIDLAIAKSEEINDKLNQLHRDSGDDSLKEKYESCSNNYDEAHHNLEIAKGYLDSDDYQNIHDRVDDVKKELKSCKHQFVKTSFDPAHIRNRNKEFGRYVEIVRTATTLFVKENDGDRARKN